MPQVAAIGLPIAASAVTGVLGAREAKKGARRAGEVQEARTREALGLLDPFREAGLGALEQIQQLAGDPGTSPLFEQLQKQLKVIK